MGNKMKKAAAVVCVGVMALTSVPAAFAAEVPGYIQQQSEIAPCLSIIVHANTEISISGRVASIDSVVTGHTLTATKAKIVSVLQVKSGSSWSEVDSWEVTNDSYNAILKKTHSVTAGKTYRVKSTMTVWEDSQKETVTAYSDEITA